MPNGVPMTWMTGLYRFPPPYVVGGSGASFSDIDGNAYLDFNVCDLSMTMGYGAKPIVSAVTKAMSTGANFLLPNEDAAIVSEELARRVDIPYWQFSLSASSANSEVIRIARHMTGRNKIAVFEGHYHGHINETLVAQDDKGKVQPDLLGIPDQDSHNTIILPFNNIEAVSQALANGDVALILTEPVLTNCTLVMPAPGFLQELRTLTKRHGTLLCYDEAHSFQFAFGGYVGNQNLETDFVVLGKGLGTGVSFALYGMSAEVAAHFRRFSDVDIGPKGIATGGTTYGSAVASAAARAALTEVLTPEGYRHIEELGKQLARGLGEIFVDLELPWKALHLGPRSGYCLFPHLPTSGAEAWLSIDPDFIDTRRIFMANRGIWDSVATSGPQVSFAHTMDDITAYLIAARQFLQEVLA